MVQKTSDQAYCVHRSSTRPRPVPDLLDHGAGLQLPAQLRHELTNLRVSLHEGVELHLEVGVLVGHAPEAVHEEVLAVLADQRPLRADGAARRRLVGRLGLQRVAQLGVHDEGRPLVGALDGGEGALDLVALQVRIAHPLDHLAVLVAGVRRLAELDLRRRETVM